MRLAKKLALGIIGGMASAGGGGGPVADAMLSALTVSANGWELTGTILSAKDGGTYNGLNDKATPGLVLEVTSKAWTTGGVQTTRTRYVYATSVLRQPTPNGAVLQETESGANCNVVWSLSSQVFSTASGDTIVGCTTLMAFFTDNGSGGSSAANPGGVSTVTNNSTAAYKKYQMCWLTPDLERITSSSWAPRLYINPGRFSQQGQPVRAVTFTATDTSGHTVTSTVSTMTSGQYGASTYYTAWFQPSWNLSTLTDGNLATVDATIYPWVGEAFTLSVDGDVYPSGNICTLKGVVDVGGTYGTVYAYVDGVGGGTPAANTNPVTAAANPYASISAAAAAGIVLNNSTFSRNSHSGVTVRVAAATTLSGLGGDGMDAQATGALPLLVEGVNQATSILTTLSTQNDIPSIIKFRNLTLERQSGANAVGFDGKTGGTAKMLACEDVIFSSGTATNAYYDGWMIQYGRGYFINCSGADAGQGSIFSTNPHATVVAVGCTFIPSKSLNFVACSHTGNGVPVSEANTSLVTPAGGVMALSRIKNSGAGKRVLQIVQRNYGDRGLGLYGLVLEGYGGLDSAALLVSGDTDTVAVENVNIIACSPVGERCNLGYNDTGSAAVSKDVVLKHSYVYKLNIKSDYFTTANANRIGNWQFRHGVDCSHNFIDEGTNNGDAGPGFVSWMGEALGDGKNELPFGFVNGGDPDWDNDLSGAAGAGGGDYRPGASTALPFIPAGETMMPLDFLGKAVPTDGTARAGALQPA